MLGLSNQASLSGSCMEMCAADWMYMGLADRHSSCAMACVFRAEKMQEESLPPKPNELVRMWLSCTFSMT